MKKFSLAVLKVLILLFSFAAIALAFIMRDTIEPTLMIATIVTALIMIFIVIALLVNEKPGDQSGKTTILPASKKTKVKYTKTTHYKLRRLENGDITFSRIVEEGEKVIKAKGKKSKKAPVHPDDSVSENSFPSETLTLEPMETLKPRNVVPDYKAINPFLVQLQVQGKHLDNLLAIIETMKQDRLVHRNPDYTNFDLLPPGIKYYESTFEAIPVVTLIKQSQNTFKVMAGTSTHKLYEIALFRGDDYTTIDHFYHNIQKISGSIRGGKYNLLDSESANEIREFEAYSVELTIHHNT